MKAGNGEIIATSEVCTSRSVCLKGVTSVRKNAPEAETVDEKE
nr:YegP family protein [uncultured Oscillibacter sp.]